MAELSISWNLTPQIKWTYSFVDVGDSNPTCSSDDRYSLSNLLKQNSLKQEVHNERSTSGYHLRCLWRNTQSSCHQRWSTSCLTFCLLAAKLHGGNHTLARWSCRHAGYFSKILSKSRLNRRSRQLPLAAWLAVFRFCSLIFRRDTEYAVDSFPIPVCQNGKWNWTCQRMPPCMQMELIAVSS